MKVPNFQKDTLINAPPDKVFAYVSDFRRHPEWASHRLSIEPVSEGPLAVGSKFKSVGHQMGMESRDEVTVSEVVADRRLTYDVSTHQGESFRHSIDLQPEGAGTRVTKSMNFVKTGIVTKLMMPLVLILVPKILSSDLQRIKSHIESAA